jgi:hypothetical protein
MQRRRDSPCRAQSLYCANRPRPAPIPLSSCASGSAERRNKAIAPYEAHCASFNFLNPLICTVASSALVGWVELIRAFTPVFAGYAKPITALEPHSLVVAVYRTFVTMGFARAQPILL